MPTGPTYEATIAQCYLKFVSLLTTIENSSWRTYVKAWSLPSARMDIVMQYCLPPPPIQLQQAEFELYRVYGENNEYSQKLLYELEEQPAFKAFFVVSPLDPTAWQAPLSAISPPFPAGCHGSGRQGR